MPTLNREHRRLLENTVAQARAIAEEGARKVLADQYAVHHHEPWPHMTPDERELRNQLRAHGRQLGDRRDERRETQETSHLVQACAYEHWHRMLFARFLAENDLLLDTEHGMAMTLVEVRELGREQNRDWLDIAAELAQRMLLAVFRPDDPVLRVSLPPETRQQLEEKLEALPAEIFRADDSLGWVYQFWQRDEKDRVNKSEVKIGADELPAVTQLFTEDYMVLFLLENTLGAWWTAKRRAEDKNPALPGYEWTYLRLDDDGAPAAGEFGGWPRAARDLSVLDPSMGSGHFLTFALPILARMRMEEEGLSHREAVVAVLRDNLFGLELDARCSQIAAFNLALAGWRHAGGHFKLPELNLACSGLGIRASEADWVKLAVEDGLAREEMRRLYSLFKDAPTLGSLIDPLRLKANVFTSGADRVLPLLEEALHKEQPNDETHELVIAAKGVLAALRLLARKYTLVATNVPYLGRGRQEPLLAKYCAEFHSDAKADLATSIVDRCITFAAAGGTCALVTTQTWLFLGPFRAFRERLLKSQEWQAVVHLGEHSFESPQAAGAFPALITFSSSRPRDDSRFLVLNLLDHGSPDEKRRQTLLAPLAYSRQAAQLANPDARITRSDHVGGELLEALACSYKGLSTGDLLRFNRCFWEVGELGEQKWSFLQGAVTDTKAYGARNEVVLWEMGHGALHRFVAERLGETGVGAWIRGAPAWGKQGIAVTQMRELPCCLYTGELFDENTAAIIPLNPEHLPAIWAFCSSPEFRDSVRRIDQSLKVPTLTLLKVPFDLSQWRVVADAQFAAGLPNPHSDDPTQWLFVGHPNGSDNPLQVAIARLVGYGWPRQTGSSFSDCAELSPDNLDQHADEDGIVCLSSIAGEASAGSRLRALLADAYGEEWSASRLSELLDGCESLEVWLRDRFFEEHCQLFQQRPFVWHIWDGRKDGFHALVNYHKLAAQNGEGLKTLEKLIYTSLGDWITRQRAEVVSGSDGADARLTAALHLKAELEKILAGEKPYDLFVRWKPLKEQPIGWEPDINDGVRMNLRPWLTATLTPSTKPKKGSCILRVTPKINYGKDRGKEPMRLKEDFPWFWTWDEQAEDFEGGKVFDGARWNDLHYSLDAKKARERKQNKEGA